MPFFFCKLFLPFRYFNEFDAVMRIYQFSVTTDFSNLNISISKNKIVFVFLTITEGSFFLNIIQGLEKASKTIERNR